MGQRRKARELAVQCIYALDFAEVTEDFREYGLLNEYPEVLRQLTSAESINSGSNVYAFADELVKNTIIAHLDKSILIVAVYELMFTDTPAAVIINEGIEIAKKFCSEHTGKFINGILDAINKGIPHSMPGRQIPT